MVSKLKYGNTNTFFIHGISGNLLIDTDYAGTLPAFYRAIKEHNIKISDIISELMELGVKLLLIDTQVEYIHFSDEIFSRDARMKYVPINKEDAVLVKCKESRVFLHSIGIEGEILSTPSHSKDSISLILDDGSCFVGDLEPIDYLDAYDNNVELKEDWKIVMSRNPKVIFYAHANERVVL